MNRQVLTNSDQIIGTLEVDDGEMEDGQRWPMPADNTHHLVAAARRRALDTRERASGRYAG